jgi:hypothetical protein
MGVLLAEVSYTKQDEGIVEGCVTGAEEAVRIIIQELGRILGAPEVLGYVIHPLWRFGGELELSYRV